MVLSRADLEGLPHVKVTASEHSSGHVNFEGVTLKSVLERAGVAFGESMRGKRLTNCLLVEAADGYSFTRVGPGVHRQEDLAGFLAGWETARWERRAIPNCHPG